MKNVIITGGGTGGHLFASLAFANYIKNMNYNPILIGSKYGIENIKLKEYEYEHILLNTRGFAGKSKIDKIKSLIGISLSIISILKFIKRKKPVFAIGFGGYTTIPVIIASKILGIQTAIVEQNAIAGRANRFLSKFVDVVFVNFKSTKRQFNNHKLVVCSGNPIRKSLIVKNRTFGKDRITIGVLGGSRGARSINKAMIELALHSNLNINLIHQTGYEDYKLVQKTYLNHKPNWRAVAFIENMENFYKNIDFIVCRAGASTLSEVACASLGSLLIPYPFAIYNHQYYNAKEFVNRHAATLIEDKNLSGKKIESIILSLNKNKLRFLSENASSLCIGNACENIIKTLQNL